MKYLLKYSLIATLVFGVSSCSFFEELETPNKNDLEVADVLSDPTTYPALISSSFGNFWNATMVSFPTMPVSVAAQEMSMSWGNWGARDLGTIPRLPLNNTQSYGNAGLIEDVWFNVYGVLVQTNNILKLIDEGNDVIVDFDGDGNTENINDIVRAGGKLLQGLSLGHLAMRYDQAFIVDENTDVATLGFSPYDEVGAAAVTKLEEAVVLFNANTFTAGWINGLNWTNTQFAQFASSYIARIIAGNSRTAAENAAANWNKVLTTANAGLPMDYAPIGDGGVVWWSRILIQGQDAVWARLSQRVVTEMAIPADRAPGGPAPYPWPDGVASLPPLTAGHDNRVTTDLTYSGAPSFSADRGYYFFSSYRYSRYDAYPASSFTTPMVNYSAMERDTYIAEALIRTGGSKTQAATLINNTRVTRGGLPALTGAESDQVLLDAIFYERRAEIGWTWPSVIFYDRRRNDDLETGTYKHMPVPARELNVLGVELYTFGGEGMEM
ncbi:MAG: hypothetical protein RIM99_05860 [Cyclobacteriaceae bacterium]